MTSVTPVTVVLGIENVPLSDWALFVNEFIPVPAAKEATVPRFVIPPRKLTSELAELFHEAPELIVTSWVNCFVPPVAVTFSAPDKEVVPLLVNPKPTPNDVLAATVRLLVTVVAIPSERAVLLVAVARFQNVVLNVPRICWATPPLNVVVIRPLPLAALKVPALCMKSPAIFRKWVEADVLVVTLPLPVIRKSPATVRVREVTPLPNVSVLFTVMSPTEAGVGVLRTTG